MDQAFSAGVETKTTPLADHQGSPRILLGHAPDAQSAVRQSVDYAPFGRVTAIRDQNGATTTADLDAAFGHHGSLLDSETGLQLKGARWYSPAMGRFVSVDPIHDGTNWYEAFGNDPVNYGDPSDLSPSFHPITGGYSGNKSTKSPIPSGMFAGSQLGTAPSYQLKSKSFDTSLRTSAPTAPSLTQQIALAPISQTPYKAPPAAVIPMARQTLTPTNQAVRNYIDDGIASRLNAADLIAVGEGQRKRDIQAQYSLTVKADHASSFTPGVSGGRDAYEVATRRDFFTQEPITGWRYGLTVGGLALPIVGAAFLRKSANAAVRAVNEALGRTDEAAEIVAEAPRTFQTYTKTNPTTAEVYAGRTSGTGTPAQNVARRDSGHHKTSEGFGPAQLDKSSDSSDAIRGREQLLIEANGGAKSQGGSSGNVYNGISHLNKKLRTYLDAAYEYFGR